MGRKRRLVITFDRQRFVRATSTVALVYAGFYCVAGGIVTSLFLFMDQMIGGGLILAGFGAFFAATWTNRGRSRERA